MRHSIHHFCFPPAFVFSRMSLGVFVLGALTLLSGCSGTGAPAQAAPSLTPISPQATTTEPVATPVPAASAQPAETPVSEASMQAAETPVPEASTLPAGTQIPTLNSGLGTQTPVEAKIDSNLLRAIRQQGTDATSTPPLQSGVEIDGAGRTVVDITTPVQDAVVARIEAAGAEILQTSARYNVIRVRIALNQIEPIAAIPEVVFIQPPQGALIND